MTTNTSAPQCAIWPEHQATECQIKVLEDKIYFVSPRAGGNYEITREAETKLKYMGEAIDVQRVRARLTTMLVEMRQQGEEWPLVTTDVIRRVSVTPNLVAYERADRLLRYFVDLAPILGSATGLGNDEFARAMVVSESIDQQEIIFWRVFSTIEV